MSKVQYIPNLKRFASKMQKENFRGKKAQSSFPYDADYLPRVETDRFIHSNPIGVCGALHVNNLYHFTSKVNEERKLLADSVTMLFDELGVDV